MQVGIDHLTFNSIKLAKESQFLQSESRGATAVTTKKPVSRSAKRKVHARSIFPRCRLPHVAFFLKERASHIKTITINDQ